jgi:cation:H+ antiporter
VAIIELILSLAAILLAAVLFTNAIEILGARLQMGQGAVGSVLAAVGTALPETMIAIVAIVGAAIAGGGAGAEIGVGAILGAPFLLTTIAMFVVGASVLGFRRRRENGRELRIDRGIASRDIGFFLVFFAIAAAAGLVALPVFVKIIVGLVLVGAYVLYVRKTLMSGGVSLEEVPERLKLWPSSWGRAPTWAVVAQNLGALVVMGVGAYFFVEAIEHGSEVVGIPPGLVALILAPLATELPEKFKLGDLAQAGQGHAGLRQHLRGDGVPEHHPRIYRNIVDAVEPKPHKRILGGSCPDLRGSALPIAQTQGPAPWILPAGRRAVLPRLLGGGDL